VDEISLVEIGMILFAAGVVQHFIVVAKCPAGRRQIQTAEKACEQ